MKEPSDIIKVSPLEKVASSAVGRIVEERAFVNGSTRIDKLANALEINPELLAVGVVDSQQKVIGVISRLHLFAQLSRPYGRDLLGRKPVTEVMEQAGCFNIHDNVFAVAKQIRGQLEKRLVTYFILHNDENCYKGVFSSIDLLRFLSRITQEDIDLAGMLQERMMLPNAKWGGSTWQAQAMLRAAKGVGGDFYFYKELQPQRHFFVLGDVSGKGVAASIITSLLWGILRGWDPHRGMRSLLKEINVALIQTFHLEKYLTGIFMLYDEEKHKVRFADMGHGHTGILRRHKVKSLQIPALNLPLGIDLDLNPQIYNLDLQHGDTLFAYSDGIGEQINGFGQEFGDYQLKSILQSKTTAVDQIPGQLETAINQWRGDHAQHDDMVWLQLHIKDKSSS